MSESHLDILRDVLRYRRGEGEYNFIRLPADQRDIAAMEAWEAIEDRIDAALSQPSDA